MTAYPDGFDPGFGLAPAAVVLVPARLALVEGDAVPIADIASGIGHTPGHVAVKTDDYAGRSRQADPTDVDPFGHELHLVPDGRQVELQVRVVAKDRIAGGRAAAADRPVVAAQVFFRQRGKGLPQGQRRRLVGSGGVQVQGGEVPGCAPGSDGFGVAPLIRVEVVHDAST